jgi:hypothetical protein
MVVWLYCMVSLSSHYPVIEIEDFYGLLNAHLLNTLPASSTQVLILENSFNTLLDLISTNDGFYVMQDAAPTSRRSERTCYSHSPVFETHWSMRQT